MTLKPNIRMNKGLVPLKAGFTMLEVIFAIFIISVGILSSYTIIQELVSSAEQSSLRLTAAYLSQEGVEIVRNIRDTNWMDPTGSLAWDNGLGAGDWEADYSTVNFTDGYDGDYLNINGNGFYGYGSGSQTLFKRKITVVHDGSDKLDISVKVYWNYRGSIKGPITVQEILYRWYQ